MQFVLPYNKLDFDYHYPVNEYSINLFYDTTNATFRNRFVSSIPLKDLLFLITENNNNRTAIGRLMKEQEEYLKQPPVERAKILCLWTNQEINTSLKAVLRSNRDEDYIKSEELTFLLIYLKCVLELNNGDMYVRSNEYLTELNRINSDNDAWENYSPF